MAKKTPIKIRLDGTMKTLVLSHDKKTDKWQILATYHHTNAKRLLIGELDYKNALQLFAQANTKLMEIKKGLENG